jgi:trk system potassium uptake protein TrkH
MPDGYFGAADSVTRWGVGYTLLLGLLAILVLLGLLARGRLPQRGLALLVTGLNVGVFVLAMASDPLVSGLVVAWNLTVLAQILVPGPRREAEPEEAADPLARWLRRWGAVVQHLSFLFLMLAIGVEGYRLTDEPLARGLVVGLGVSTLALSLPFLVRKIRTGSRVALLVLVPLVVAVLFVPRPATSIALLVLTIVLLLALLTAQRRTTSEVLQLFLDHPSRLVAISFVTVILVGAVLLTFPAASATGVPISPLDALFTSTSATCVTGLVVLDTPTAFSPLGHVILLALIQIGGLGIMVLSTFGTLIMGGSLGLRGARALKEMLQIDAERTALRLVRFIVLATVSLEAVGALLLTLAFDDLGVGPWQALWKGIFHSVSAFCNAGFSLQSDSLVQLQSNPLAVLTVAALITLGGLGFSVLAALWTLLRPREVRERLRLDLQSKTVLVASALLVVVGWGLFAVFEWHGSLEGLSGLDKALNALFQSVTLRTAGFNTVPFDNLLPVSALFMMVWMFIGASPGGTGGGLKTTTLVVLLAAVVALGRGSTSVNLFDREVPREIVYRGLAVFVLSSGVTLGALLLLLLVESQPFEALAFETASAVGTVGLSLGATPNLGAAGKLVIIGAMFIGRIGPLTLVLFLGRGGARRRTFRYPESRLMVG